MPHKTPDWSADTLSGIISNVEWWFAVHTFMNLTVVSIACDFYFVKYLFWNLYFLFVFMLFNYFVFRFLFFSFINNLFIVLNLNPAQLVCRACTPELTASGRPAKIDTKRTADRKEVHRCQRLLSIHYCSSHYYYSTFFYGRGRHDGDIFLNDF